MRGALVGFGTIAEGHLAAYKQVEDISITAVVDPVLARQKRAAEAMPGIRAYAALDGLFAHEDLDFIDVCSPPNSHSQHIRTGLLNQVHVLCEKPFLLKVEEYKGILSLAKSANRIVYPSHNYKFAPVLYHIRSVVQASQFGQIIAGHFRTIRAGHALGVREWRPHWRRDPIVAGGGILRDHGTHSIYLACDICEKTPSSVSCLTGNLDSEHYPTTEDTTFLTVFFDDVKFRIDLTWAASFRNTLYSIIGTRGSVTVENDDVCLVDSKGQVRKRAVSSEFNDPSHKLWFRAMLRDFIDTAANPDKQLPNLLEALTTTLVVEQAYASAKQGGTPMEVPRPTEALL